MFSVLFGDYDFKNCFTVLDTPYLVNCSSPDLVDPYFWDTECKFCLIAKVEEVQSTLVFSPTNLYYYNATEIYLEEIDNSSIKVKNIKINFQIKNIR